MATILRSWKDVAFSSPAMRCSTPSPRWIHSPLGVMKLYFDGSAIGNSCVAGVGGLVRDSGGTTIFYFFRSSRLLLS